MSQVVSQEIGALMFTVRLVAVDFTVLVFSTNGHASQGLLQGLFPLITLLGLVFILGSFDRIIRGQVVLPWKPYFLIKGTHT